MKSKVCLRPPEPGPYGADTQTLYAGLTNLDEAMIERHAIKQLSKRWADATRHMRWDEAEQLWRELMLEWLKPTLIDQGYWNRLIDRRMAALERKERRSAVSDEEWDNTHQDMGR